MSSSRPSSLKFPSSEIPNFPMPFLPTMCLIPDLFGKRDAMLEERCRDVQPRGPRKARLSSVPPLTNTAPDGSYTYFPVRKVKKRDSADAQRIADIPTQLLFEAVKNGDQEAAEQAIADGADVNAENKAGKSPLDIAYDNVDFDMFNFLKQKGAA